MYIKSITVEDFLPFQGRQRVDFSTDKDRNVTLIMGNNGAGKTSLAQAFEWCLYGRPPKDTNQVINAYVKDRIRAGSFHYVTVEIELIKNGMSYTVSRRQRYTRSSNGRTVKGEQQEFGIFYKEGGQTRQVPQPELRATINRLLSQELSHYFFFDGEHVKNMRAEIEHGKSSDFAEAVKTILGLRPIASALEHLRAPGTRASVERRLRQQLDLSGNQELESKRQRIRLNEAKIERLEGEIEDAELDAQTAQESVDNWNDLLLENQESEQAAHAVEVAKRDVKRTHAVLDAKRDALFEVFRRGHFRFFTTRPIRDARAELKDTDKISKGVPSVNDKTIKFLLERHECICGTKFEDGDSIAQHLYELLSYVPPKDLGTYIAEFDKECRTRSEGQFDLREDIAKAYNEYTDAENAAIAADQALSTALAHLDSINHVDVNILRANLRRAEQDLKKCQDSIAVAKRDITRAKSENKQLESEIERATFQDEKNKFVQQCLAYVEYIYDYLDGFYSTHEAGTREELGATVNKFFTAMYDGELHLVLDENYGVTVVVDDIDTGDEVWKTSSGQTLAIILAFILGILDIAKSNIRSGEELLQGDTYPLVMDAPLSDFDKTRIGTICGLLPDVAEQVVIIIKDTDGDLAEQHLASKIGARYTIERNRDYDSRIKKD